jgi:hypothetical protein
MLLFGFYYNNYTPITNSKGHDPSWRDDSASEIPLPVYSMDDLRTQFTAVAHHVLQPIC